MICLRVMDLPLFQQLTRSFYELQTFDLHVN